MKNCARWWQIHRHFGRGLINLLPVLTVCLVCSSAQAGIWDQLSEEDRQFVTTKLKDELPKLLEQGDMRDYAEFSAKHVDNWSTHAGEIVEGKFDGAIEDAVAWGKDQFLASFEDEFKTRVEALDSAALSFIYSKGVEHKEATRDMARAALSGQFDEAGRIAWDTAKGDLSDQIASLTEGNLRHAYNWAFDGGKVYGYTPADILLAAIRIETIVIPEIKSYLTNSQLEQILTIYRQSLEGAGGNHAAAWDMINQSHIVVTAHSISSLNEVVLRRALEDCGNSTYKTLGGCIREVQTELQQRVDAEKRLAQEAIEAATRRAKEQQNAVYERVREAIRRIIAEHDQEFKAALAEAQSLLATVQTQVNGLVGDCTRFSEKLAVVEQAIDIARASNGAVNDLNRFISLGSDCAPLNEAPTDLHSLLEDLRATAGEFDSDLQLVEDLTNGVCAKADAIKPPLLKAEARPLLDESVDSMAKLVEAISELEAKAEQVRQQNGDIATAVNDLSAQLDLLVAEIGAAGSIEATLEAVQKARDVRPAFESAVSEMTAIADRLVQRQENLKQLNPAELDLMEWVDKGLAGGIDTSDKTRIHKLLKQYRDFPGVNAVLEDIRAAAKSAACADTALRQYNSASGGGQLKWKALDVPEALTKGAHEALLKCGNLPDGAEFASIAKSAADIAADMEARELPWIYRKQAETCIASGMAAYDTLPDPYEALGSDVAGLEATCMSADRAAASAVQTAGSLEIQAADLLARVVAQVGLTSSGEVGLACDTVMQVRSGIHASVAMVATARSAAETAASNGRAKALSCTSAQAANSIDPDLDAITIARQQAAQAYSEAQLGEHLLDEIIRQAVVETGRLRLIKDAQSQLLLQRAAIDGMIRNLAADRQAASRGFETCAAEQSRLRGLLSGDGQSMDPLLADLLRRVDAVDGTPTQDLGNLDAAVNSARTALDMQDSAMREVDMLLAKAQSCATAETAFEAMLKAGESILAIESMHNDVIQRQQDCIARSNSSGRDDYVFGEDSGNVKTPPSPGGGSVVVSPPLDDSDSRSSQNTAQSGSGIDSGYTSDPYSDKKRDDRENAGHEPGSTGDEEGEVWVAPPEGRDTIGVGDMGIPTLPDSPAQGSRGDAAGSHTGDGEALVEPAQRPEVTESEMTGWRLSCVNNRVFVVRAASPADATFNDRGTAELAAAKYPCPEESAPAPEVPGPATVVPPPAPAPTRTSPQPAAPPTVAANSFAGRWTGARACDASGDGAFKWVVDLHQSGSQVSGRIGFHKCPGGGRAEYLVAGTASAAKSVVLTGTLVSSRGPLGKSARSTVKFTITRGKPPSPDLSR